jgi:single-stranded DNA-binding protein
MNSCLLQAQVLEAPQLRYTSENQTPIAEMLVEFPALRAEDPPSQLKVIGWGNLAQELQSRCQVGDPVILEGRLRINNIPRPDGRNDKQAELTLARLHHLGDSGTVPLQPAADAVSPANLVPSTAAVAPPPKAASPKAAPAKVVPSSSPVPMSVPLEDLTPSDDDIPF